MKKLSLEALKAQNVVSTELMEKITGGLKTNCHCVPTSTGTGDDDCVYIICN